MEQAGWACALIGERGWRLMEDIDAGERLAIVAVAKVARDARSQMAAEQARMIRGR